MKLVRADLAVKARLMPPTSNGYLLFAAEVGAWLGPFLPPNATRTAQLARLRAMATELARRPEVSEATVFRGVFRTPGEGKEILDARGLPHARYDVVVLIRTVDVAAAKQLRDDPAYRQVVSDVEVVGRHTYEAVAHNDARIDDVDHGPDHAFLFNFFYADDTEIAREAWEYTAGWFQTKTALPNSTVVRPLDGEPTDHGIVNHASWPGFRTFLPSLLFRPTFRRFVLANFQANDVAAQPIIYRRL